jgi:hypothetical protein
MHKKVQKKKQGVKDRMQQVNITYCSSHEPMHDRNANLGWTILQSYMGKEWCGLRALYG